MGRSVGSKILIVFIILLIGWFFVRVLRMIIPMVIIAIIVGFVWDLIDGKDDERLN